MIMTDLLLVAMLGTWLLSLDEYKDKIMPFGKKVFKLVSITGVATIILSYVFYSMAQIALKDYGNVISWYEDVRIIEMSEPSAQQKEEVRAFYKIMASNPEKLTRREYLKLKSQYKSVIHTK